MSKDKENRFSRRSFLGSGLLLPFLGMAQSPVKKIDEATGQQEEESDDGFTTMLTSDGSAVRVRKSSLKKAKIVEQNMSNQSLLKWLRLKDKG